MMPRPRTRTGSMQRLLPGAQVQPQCVWGPASALRSQPLLTVATTISDACRLFMVPTTARWSTLSAAAQAPVSGMAP